MLDEVFNTIYSIPYISLGSGNADRQYSRLNPPLWLRTEVLEDVVVWGDEVAESQFSFAAKEATFKVLIVFPVVLEDFLPFKTQL